MSLRGLILAAGKGKRMNSDLPKVLHPIAGIPMLEWVLKALMNLPCDQASLVLSANSKDFLKVLDRYPEVTACIQVEANGTGGAVAAAQCLFDGVQELSFANGILFKGEKKKADEVLICAGDTPALDVKILRKFVENCRSESAKLGVLGMYLPEPTGYGRLVLSDKGELKEIVEEKDASPMEKKISLCNSGIIFADVEYLFRILGQIENKNAQGEYYLTDCVRIAVNQGERIAVTVTHDWESLQGVNDREQLASLETWFKKYKASVGK